MTFAAWQDAAVDSDSVAMAAAKFLLFAVGRAIASRRNISAIGRLPGDLLNGEPEGIAIVARVSNRRSIRQTFAASSSFATQPLVEARLVPLVHEQGELLLELRQAERGGEVERVVVLLGEAESAARRRSLRYCSTSASLCSSTPNVGSRPASVA